MSSWFRQRWVGGALLASMLTLPDVAAANDTALSSGPGRVQILKNRKIAMVSEDITLRFDAPCLGHNNAKFDKGWKVSATYVFRNLSKTRQKVRMGFPEFLCDAEFGDCAGQDPTFQNMVTTVRGKRVPHKIVRLEPDPKDSNDSFDRIWAYDLTFAPRERLTIVHEFGVVGWIDIAGARGIAYLVSTGNNWAKSIGRATFRFLIPAYVKTFRRLPDQVLANGSRTGLKQRSRKYVIVDGKPMMEMVYQARNWNPTRDSVSIDFESGCTGYLIDKEPPPWNPKERAKALGQPDRYCSWDDFFYAYSRRIEDVDMLMRTKSDLQMCKHTVHAQVGRIFDDPYLQEYFYGGQKPTNKVPAPAFAPTRAYSHGFLTAADRRALARFEIAQTARREATTTPSSSNKASLKESGKPVKPDPVASKASPDTPKKPGLPASATTKRKAPLEPRPSKAASPGPAKKTAKKGCAVAQCETHWHRLGLLVLVFLYRSRQRGASSPSL